jgi:hypothetical protein
LGTIHRSIVASDEPGLLPKEEETPTKNHRRRRSTGWAGDRSLPGGGCDAIAGSLAVRSFEDGEDPLDPSTDDDDPIAADTVTGRLVRPNA